MDPENQDRIKSLVDEHGADDVVVVLGAADLEALEVAAETVTLGDPAYVGSLAGVQLGLPVVHILEEDVKEQVDAGVYDEQVGLLEMTLDVMANSLVYWTQDVVRRGLIAEHGISAVVVDCETSYVRLGLAEQLADHLSAPSVRLSQLRADALAAVVKTQAA